MFIIIDILYSVANLKIMVLIDNKRLIYLINIGAKIYLIREEKIYKFGLSYMADWHLKLININGDKIIIINICENIKINISPIIVI